MGSSNGARKLLSQPSVLLLLAFSLYINHFPPLSIVHTNLNFEPPLSSCWSCIPSSILNHLFQATDHPHHSPSSKDRQTNQCGHKNDSLLHGPDLLIPLSLNMLMNATKKMVHRLFVLILFPSMLIRRIPQLCMVQVWLISLIKKMVHHLLVLILWMRFLP
jgi:hypothetical protein